jgi:hypothetical protein
MARDHLARRFFAALTDNKGVPQNVLPRNGSRRRRKGEQSSCYRSHRSISPKQPIDSPVVAMLSFSSAAEC